MCVCVCMTHVCFYVCCSDSIGVCEIDCCVAAAVKDSGVLSPESVELCCIFV